MGEGISGFGSTLVGAVTGEIGEITNISVPGLEANAIDKTNMKSTDGWKEKIAGLKDAKQIQADLIYEADNMATILEAVGEANESWTITFPDGSTFVCDGFIQSLGGTKIPMDDKIVQSITIELSGVPVFTEGPSA